MHGISREVWSFLDGEREIKICNSLDIRQRRGLLVKDYHDLIKLIKRVAWLAYKNPEFVLLFRGQEQDHKNSRYSTNLYPSLFRSVKNRLLMNEIKERFSKLEKAEELLSDRYDLDGDRRIRIHQILRWAIIQHYGVCSTPLLDVTQSLRAACSFTQLNQSAGTETYLYVLGLPQISGSVTASSEHGVQIIRLLSICPPAALRPHYQEAYLIGEYPSINFKSKREYERTELDFSRRLICKFRLKHSQFWNEDFTMLPHTALFPDEKDKLKAITDGIKRFLL